MAAKAASQPGAATVRELARLVGKSHTAVGKWLRHDAWTFGRGPWPAATVARIRAWSAATLAEDPSAAGPREVAGDGRVELKDLPIAKQVDVGLKLSRKKTIDFRLERDRGLVHPVDECRRRQLRQIHEVKTAFLNMPDGLPVDADVKVMIKGRVLEILRKWSAPAEPTPDSHGAAAAVPGTAAAGG